MYVDTDTYLYLNLFVYYNEDGNIPNDAPVEDGRKS